MKKTNLKAFIQSDVLPKCVWKFSKGSASIFIEPHFPPIEGVIGGLDHRLDTSAKSLRTGLDNCSLLICRPLYVPNVAGMRNSTAAVKKESA